MPLGVLTDQQYEAEVTRLNIQVIEIERGRGNKLEVPESLRAFVASEAIAGASAQQLSEDYNISKSSISAYKHGSTSTASYNEPDARLQSSNDEIRQRIVGPAQKKIIAALNAITEEKLNGAKLKDASAVARDMSTIVKNMQPDPSVVVNNNRTIIYKPRTKEEDSYEVIEVEE